MNILRIVTGAGLVLGATLAWGQEPKTETPPTQATQAQTPDTAASAKAAAPAGNAPGADSKVKTRNYKGDLVGAACSEPGTETASNKPSTQPSGEADRAAGGDAAKSGCGLSAGTTEFALRTKDGRVLTFDSVGNLRAQEALKQKKNWEQTASSGKPIPAKVSGVEDEGRLTVLSIH
ncbi:MAG: hypothetical protein LAP40_21255 [Acidobacteriia bacterium]|nr:hypothetical protein [Terriglobia bacterium]